METMMEAPTLHDLILQIAKGDEASFRTLYDQMYPLILNYLRGKYGRSLGEKDFEDICQHTFIQVWFHAKKYRGKHTDASARQWMFTIAKNEALKLLRTMRHLQSSLDTVFSDSDFSDNDFSNLKHTLFPSLLPSPEDEAIQSVLIEKIIILCKRFPKREQDIFKMRFLHRYTFAQIGKKNGLTAPRVKQIVDQILKKIYYALQ